MSRTPVNARIETPAPLSGDSDVLRVEGLAGYGGPGQTIAFAIPAGGAHVIAGGPGSGKTSLLELIAAARPPPQGRIELFGKNLESIGPRERPRLRRRIGMIFHDLRLVEDMSAHDNIALAALAADRAPQNYEAEVAELLAWVGLTRKADVAAGSLNGEGRRRLAVARALINRPELVVADEPFGDSTFKLLSDLNSGGIAILIATRDLDLAVNAGAEITQLADPGVRS